MKLCSFNCTNEYNYNQFVNKYLMHNLSCENCFDVLILTFCFSLIILLASYSPTPSPPPPLRFSLFSLSSLITLYFTSFTLFYVQCK